VLGAAAFWRSAVGHALAVKMTAVVLMITISAIHDFVSRAAARSNRLTRCASGDTTPVGENRTSSAVIL